MILKKVVCAAYKYIFYKLYRWSQAVNGESRLHEVNAVIMLTLTIAMYLFALAALMQLPPINLRIFFVNPDIYGEIFVVLFSVILFGLNFYILKQRIGFGNIISEFENESAFKRKVGNSLAVLYVIGSLVLPIFLGIYIAARNSS